MKLSFLFAMVAAFVSCGAVYAQQSADTEIQAIMARSEVESDRIAAAEKAEADPLKAAFVRQIQQLRDAAQTRGDLDAVLELNEALKAAQAGAPLPSAKRAAAQLDGLKANLERGIAAISKKYEPARARLAADFQRMMTDLEQRFTRNKDLDGALKVREAKQKGLPGGGVVGGSDILSQMKGTTERQNGMIAFKSGGGIQTEASYKPPIEIWYELKSDNQVRIGYAATEIIFNWEGNRTELRIGGGPATGQHRADKGGIPKDKFVMIRQVVLPKKMSVFVDGQERATWEGDFSKVNQPIRIFPHGDMITVKRVLVKKP